MTDELPASSPADDACDVWQQQLAGAFPMSPEVVHRRIQKYQRGLLVGILISAAACLVVIVGFISMLSDLRTSVERVGAVLIVVGAGYILSQLVQLWRQKRAAVMTPGGSARASIEFYRAALERQRDFHRGRIFWSRMIAFSPGIAIFFGGSILANPGDDSVIYVGIATVLLLASAIPLNLSAARKFQRQIDALNRLQQEQ